MPLAVPLTAPPLTAPFTASTMLTDVPLPTPLPEGDIPPTIIMHIPMYISTPDPATLTPPSPALPVTSGLAAPAPAPPLSAAEWLTLISKFQTGDLPPITISPLLVTTPLPTP